MAKIQKRASIYKSYRYKPQKFVQDIFSPAHYNAHCVGMVVNYLSRWRENYDIGYLLHAKRYLSKIDKTDFIFRSAYCLGLADAFCSQLYKLESQIIKTMLSKKPINEAIGLLDDLIFLAKKDWGDWPVNQKYLKGTKIIDSW